MSKALVILSGGQDSTTCLFWAKQNYSEIAAITFDYGQRHKREIEAAKKVASLAGVINHEIVAVPNILKSASPLTSSNPLEQYKDAEEMGRIIGDRVELTFVPMRNILFFTIGANRAIASNCRTLVTGICQEDNANYPDCTDIFRASLENSFNESLGFPLQSLRIDAPLMYKSKAQSIDLALSLPGCYAALAYSHTSYDGQYPPVGHDHATLLRAKGFEEAGVPDPLVLRANIEGLMELPMTDNYADYLVEYYSMLLSE